MIYLQGMTNLTVDTPYPGAYSPYINGVLSLEENGTLKYAHGTWKANTWEQTRYDFFYTLAAGSVVTYAWNPHAAQSFW